MRLLPRPLQRHLPAIATCFVIAWLATVYAYAVGDSSASAGRPTPKRLVKAALGAKPPHRHLEVRTSPVTADVRPVAAHPPSSDTDTERRSRKAKPPARKAPKKNLKRKKPKRDLGHVPPVAPRLTTEHELREPHHDYPALDLALKSGTKVVAVTSGRVRATTKWGACGKGVILSGRDDFTYTYCHGSKLLVGRGRHVSKGQGVLRSGNTGDSTGPHLHLQIRRPNGKLVCPQDLLPAWVKGVPKSPWEAGRVGCRTGGHRHKGEPRRR